MYYVYVLDDIKSFPNVSRVTLTNQRETEQNPLRVLCIHFEVVVLMVVSGRDSSREVEVKGEPG